MAGSSVNWASIVNGTVANSGAASSQPATTGTNALGNRDTFIRLLMAQIQHQNPLNPTDGTQFVTQLATFSTLEQNMQANSTLNAIKADLDKLTGVTTQGTQG